MSNGPPVDALEKRIRIGCGFVAGPTVGLFSGFVTLNLVAGPLWAFAIAWAALFAFLAMRYGDRFRVWLLRYW